MKKLITLLLLAFTLTGNAQVDTEKLSSNLKEFIEHLLNEVNKNEERTKVLEAEFKKEIDFLRNEIKNIELPNNPSTSNEIKGIDITTDYKVTANDVTNLNFLFVSKDLTNVRITIPELSLSGTRFLFIYNKGNANIEVVAANGITKLFKGRKRITYFSENGYWQELEFNNTTASTDNSTEEPDDDTEEETSNETSPDNLIAVDKIGDSKEGATEFPLKEPLKNGTSYNLNLDLESEGSQGRFSIELFEGSFGWYQIKPNQTYNEGNLDIEFTNNTGIAVTGFRIKYSNSTPADFTIKNLKLTTK